MFINTLPIIFTYTSIFSIFEASIFFTAIFFLVYVYTPEVNKNWKAKPSNSFYNFLHSAWDGNSSLWIAFWPFFLLVNIILIYIDYRIMNLTYTINSWKTAHGMMFLPIIWWTTSVWRCSKNSRYKFYSGAARTITIYLFLEYFLRFIISSLYPSTFFDCRLLILAHSDCL
jgi:hypothetical protein